MAIYDKNPDHLSLAYLWDENPFEHLKPSFAPTTEKERSQLTGPALGQISGVFDSVLNGPLPWRGKHHRAALTLLELEPEVTAVELVPETLSVRINDMRVAFTPAFRIHHRTGDRVDGRPAAQPNSNQDCRLGLADPSDPPLLRDRRVRPTWHSMNSRSTSSRASRTLNS